MEAQPVQPDLHILERLDNLTPPKNLVVCGVAVSPEPGFNERTFIL